MPCQRTHDDLVAQIRSLEHQVKEMNQARPDLMLASKQWLDTVNVLSQAICLLDGEGRIVKCNRSMQDLVNKTESEIIGRHCFQIIHGTNGPLPECPLAKAMKNKQREKTVIDLGLRRFEVSVVPKLDEAGQINGYIHIMSDITEIQALEKQRQHAESQLRQAQKMEAIGTLAGGIAHDFNNILSAILGYSELALDDARSGQPSERYISQILKAGHRARDLVHQILTFSRQTETEVKPIQIKPIIKEALKLLRASLPSSIDIDTAIQSEAIVEADPIQVHQVIMNLCTNAGHAMRDQGGTLTVALTKEKLDENFTGHHPEMTPGEHLKLTVSDTGPGMDEDILDKIFDPYFTTKTQDEGTGMGLAVVQGIIKAYKGTVSVVSTPEQGSTFDVYFPVIHADGAVRAESKIIVPGGHERIMFVDDELPLADLSQELLERLGYKVTVRTSAIEALNLFENDPDAFDLVITDMTMPHMTGDILAEKLLVLRPDIPIVICTGYSDKITQALIDRLNIRALVMKPIIRNELLITVRQVLDEQNQ